MLETNEAHILDRGRSSQPWPAGAEAEAAEAEADDAAPHFQLVAKLTNTNPTASQSVVQTNEGRILDRGCSNHPWPAGAENRGHSHWSVTGADRDGNVEQP